MKPKIAKRRKRNGKVMDSKFNVVLIYHVKKNGCLYNKALPDFKDRSKKDNCWTEIAEILNVTVDECLNRWKSLRDTYRKQVNKPSSERAKTPWKYTNHMTFLDDCKIKRRNGERDSINVDSDSEDVNESAAVKRHVRLSLAPQRNRMRRINVERKVPSPAKKIQRELRPAPPTKPKNVPDNTNETSNAMQPPPQPTPQPTPPPAQPTQPTQPFTDESDILGRSWALAYRNLPSHQKIFARRGIEEVIFEAQMGTLRRDSIQINMTMDEQMSHHNEPLEEVLLVPKADYVDLSHYGEFS